MKITNLELRHEGALKRFRDVIRAAGDTDIHGFFAPQHQPHKEIVQDLDSWARGGRLLEGWVPSTTLFAEQDDGELLGVVNLRHHLNDFLRTYGGHIGFMCGLLHDDRVWERSYYGPHIEAVRRRGIRRFMITTESNNSGSIAVIEACRGVFEAEYHHESMDCHMRRFWIDVRPLVCNSFILKAYFFRER